MLSCLESAKRPLYVVGLTRFGAETPVYISNRFSWYRMLPYRCVCKRLTAPCPAEGLCLVSHFFAVSAFSPARLAVHPLFLFSAKNTPMLSGAVAVILPLPFRMYACVNSPSPPPQHARVSFVDWCCCHGVCCFCALEQLGWKHVTDTIRATYDVGVKR